MANNSQIKALINEKITTNGTGAITGSELNNVLTQMVLLIGQGRAFAGIATPSGTPSTYDRNVFWLATQAGTYTNFGSLVIPEGLSVILYNEVEDVGSYSFNTLIEIDDEPTSGSDNLVSSGAIHAAIQTAIQAVEQGATEIYDISANNSGASYSTLAAALALVPQVLQKGGISVKYIDSTSGKYVQYRLLSTSWSTNSSDWEKAGLLYNGTGQNTDGAMTQKATTDAIALSGNTKEDSFIEAEFPYKNILIEAYFTGLNPSHSYGFKYLKYYASGNYSAIQAYLQDNTANITVCSVEYRTTTDYVGILRLSEKNSSGVSGYVVVDIKTTQTANFDNTLNIQKASILENSPLIHEYLHPYNPIFDSVSDVEIYKRIQQVKLYNADATKKYSVSKCGYYISGNYKAYQIYIVDQNNTTVCSREIQSVTDIVGLYKINEYSNSGIYAYVYVNMSVNDTQNITGELNTGKVLAYEQYYTPPVADSLPFVSKDTEVGLGDTNDATGSFSGVTNPMVAAFENMNFAADGVLSRLCFSAKGNTMTFGIGIIDQRDIAVIRKRFTIDCTPNTKIDLDVTAQGIKVNAGETLFALFQSDNTSIRFKNNTEASSIQMIYSREGGELHRHSSTYGSKMDLYWEYAQIQSPFALKENVDAVDEKASNAVEMATTAMSNFGLVKDRQGNYYQMIVVDGSISLIPLQYEKVLVICNSIGVNGRRYDLGWCARRGMASSRDSLDFRTHLENGLKQKDANAEVVLRNVWEWENDFDSITPAQLMSGYLTSDIDCIIFRAGENIPKTRDDIAENVVDLMAYCISQCPNANIFVTSMVWEKGDINNDLLQAANELGVPFIDVLSTDSEYRERLGDYLEGDYTSDEGQTWDTSTKVLYKITGSGVASHTNDVGMLRIANNILSALKYDTLPLLHSISIGETNGYTCSLITNEWVEGGIVNVASDGNAVSVVDSSNNSIVVTDHNDGIFTFEMPNSDVVISVS